MCSCCSKPVVLHIYCTVCVFGSTTPSTSAACQGFVKAWLLRQGQAEGQLPACEGQMRGHWHCYGQGGRKLFAESHSEQKTGWRRGHLMGWWRGKYVWQEHWNSTEEREVGKKQGRKRRLVNISVKGVVKQREDRQVQYGSKNADEDGTNNWKTREWIKITRVQNGKLCKGNS